MSDDKHPYQLSDAELLDEAYDVALRIAGSKLPVRDVVIVNTLAARLEARAALAKVQEVSA